MGPEDSIQIEADKYFWAHGLAAVTLDRRDAATEAVTELRNMVDQRDDENAATVHFTAASQYLEGVLDQNPGRITEGIETMLERHRLENFAGKTTYSDLVCVEATAMTIVARRRGFDVDPESDYVPMDYVEFLESE